MALVVNEDEFKEFMGRHSFDTKWLGTQYKIIGKKQSQLIGFSFGIKPSLSP